MKEKELRKGRDGKPVTSRRQSVLKHGHPEDPLPDQDRGGAPYDVNGAKIFSKLDIIKAFHQFQLENEQMNLTTITTREGILRYRRLNMGISCDLVCFLSRLLTDVERRYSQCEKEALAVVREKAAIYLIGHHFRVVVDNRAVMLIYGNARSKPPARVER